VEGAAGTEGTLHLAVIIGHHAFDVPNFWRLFQRIPGAVVYPQTLANFAADRGKVRDWYDAVVFYNYHQQTPGLSDAKWSRETRETLERLGTTEQGIVILHHDLVAFPQWDYWTGLCGLVDRRFTAHADQPVAIENSRPDHPITRAVPNWEMIDETYQMEPAGPENDILLVTRHALRLRTIAWTREHRRARVFCFQSGHDQAAYGHLHFGTVLARGIAWAARRL
jgi:uncharacterized protein